MTRPSSFLRRLSSPPHVIGHDAGRRLVEVGPVAVVLENGHRARREPHGDLVAGLVVALAVVEQCGQLSVPAS
jgi:hypothetical protein